MTPHSLWAKLILPAEVRLITDALRLFQFGPNGVP